MFQCWCLHGLPSEELWGNQPLDTACEGSGRSQEAWSNLSCFPRAMEREWCWESLANEVLTFTYCGERKANVLSSILEKLSSLKKIYARLSNIVCCMGPRPCVQRCCCCSSNPRFWAGCMLRLSWGLCALPSITTQQNWSRMREPSQSVRESTREELAMVPIFHFLFLEKNY